MVVPVEQYRQLLAATLPLAEMRGDTNTYSDVTFTVDGDRVRVKAVRYSNLKHYESPLELLVGPDEEGEWKILEEISESRP